MADEIRGSLGAQTYALPQVAPATPYQQAPYNDEVKAMEGLQYVKGQTADYYKKVQALKSFMQDAHANLGVDVRVPDMSKPESIKLHQIYNDALADILNQGNELKTGQGFQMMRDQRGVQYAEGVDPNAQSASTLRSGQDFYERPLEQQVSQTNDLTQQPTYDAGAEASSRKVYEDKIAEYDRLIAQNPERKSYYEYQKRGLTPPVQHLKQFAPQRYSEYQRKSAAKDNAIEVQLKKLVNTQDATTPQWKASTEPLPGGEPGFYKINTEYKGLRLADLGTIEKMRLNTGTGEREWVLKDGTVVPVDNDPATVMQQLVDNNPRFGVNGAELYDYIQRKGLGNETGAVDPSRFLAPKEEREANQARLQQEEAVNVAKQEPLKNAIKEKLKGAKPGFFWNDKEELDIPIGAGNKIKIAATGDDKFTLDNFDDIFPPTMFIDPTTKKVDKAKRDKVKANLEDQPLDKVIEEVLKRVPVSSYPAVYKALGLDPSLLKGSSKLVRDAKKNTGTQVAPTTTPVDDNAARAAAIKAKYGIK